MVRYDVVITAGGLSEARATRIPVTIASRQRVDLVLPAGSATATVDVVSGVQLQPGRDTSERGQIVTSYEVAALLTTGARQTTSSLTSTSNTGLIRKGSFTIDGQRSIFNNLLLDGMDNNAYGESNQGFSNQIT